MGLIMQLNFKQILTVTLIARQLIQEYNATVIFAHIILSIED